MFVERTTANDAINSMIINEYTTGWRHEYIGSDETPRCDLKNQIIYSPKFGMIVDPKDDAMVRGKNLHESAHARLSKMMDCDCDKILHSIVNAMEDVRIEEAISRINPIIEKDLREMNISLHDSLCKNIRNANPGVVSPINEAIAAMMFAVKGMSIDWNLSDKAQKYFDSAFETFKKVFDIKNLEERNGFDEVVELSKKIYEQFKECKREENSEKNDSSNDGSGSSDSGDGEYEDSEEMKEENESSEEKNESSSSSSKENGEESNEENDEKNDGSGSSNSESELEDSEEMKDKKEEKGKGNSKKSSEGNCGSDENDEAEADLEEDFGDDLMEETIKQEFKRISEENEKNNGCYTSYTLGDVFEVVEENQEKYERARDKISAQIDRMSSYVEDALRSMSRSRNLHGLEKGKIDKKKLCHLSKSLTKKVFTKKTEGIDLDVSVTILIDESGSIDCMCYELQTLTIAFSEVFSKLNINFEILGFTTTCWSTPEEYKYEFTRSIPIKMKVYKNFSERYFATRNRLGNISSEKQNVDGESLLYANKRLSAERTKRKILFVLSDGVPSCGHNDFDLCQHLDCCVESIRKSGTEIYAFGIGTNEPKRFYGEDNFVYLNNCKELGPAFFRRFKEIIEK